MKKNRIRNRPAEFIGIVYGVIIGIMLWCVIAAVVWWFIGCGSTGSSPEITDNDVVDQAAAEQIEPDFNYPQIDQGDITRSLNIDERVSWCLFIENVSTVDPIDGIDLEGIFCEDLPEPLINDTNPNCNVIKNTSCHDDGVIQLINPGEQTLCHEFIHYLLYVFDLNPPCKNVPDKQFCEHNFDMFDIQDYLCAGV
jgi:hypothetical protein